MPREVDRHQVQRLVAEGVQLVDVMGHAEFERSHLVGAVNIPIRKIADLARSHLDPGRGVITYCYDSL